MQPLVGLTRGAVSDWETLQHTAPDCARWRSIHTYVIFREVVSR